MRWLLLGALLSCPISPAVAGTADCNRNRIPDQVETLPSFADETVDPSGGLVRELALADLDGDGDPDLLAAKQNLDRFVWYENLDGAGSFGPEVLLGAANTAFGVAAGDLDGDGDLDVFGAAFLEPGILVYVNDGAGGFSSGSTLVVADGATSVRTADLDGDGDEDLLASFEIDNFVAWYENLDGAGTLGPRRVVADEQTVNGPQHVGLGDIDGDGDSDVLTASFFDDRIAWYRNEDGQGEFGGPLTISILADGARRVHAGDLDGDGDLDVVSSNGDFGAVAWYENVNGSGRFTSPRLVSEQGDTPRQVALTDLDNDGDLDLVAAQIEADAVVWYRNDGAGTFDPERPVGNAPFPWAVVAADVDGNGSKDVLSGNLTIVLHRGRLDDCNGNSVPDECEPDCNGNGIADGCEPDCNGNGIADECDIAAARAPTAPGSETAFPTNASPTATETASRTRATSPPAPQRTATGTKCRTRASPTATGTASRTPAISSRRPGRTVTGTGSSTNATSKPATPRTATPTGSRMRARRCWSSRPT